MGTPGGARRLRSGHERLANASHLSV